ncbi:MAG TPA: archaeosine biosynthesis radical SAM protein RaSEA [Methanobacterium sp.]|nr:archaeosine biosynthesis radical SAM protein RaSEA [Methanobacterium sp.]
MEIQDLNQEIRSRYLERMDTQSPQSSSASWSGEDLLYSGVGNAIFIILPTPGCAWALSESGGCTMCSYIADSPLQKVSSEDLVEIFKKELSRFKVQPRTVVKIFVSGSFLNEDEIPKDARVDILKILKNQDNIEEVVVESRPEFVTEEVVEECCKQIPHKIFEISMGLESSSDHVKKYRINKGFSSEDFERAVNIIKKLKSNYNVTSKAYLFVKPILTSEKEAIEDAVASAQYAQEVGVDRISFCPATIHKGTLMEVLWRRRAYQPPWIWSILEIMKITRKSLKIPVIMDTSGFGSRRGPYNCKKCNKKLKNMIIRSNLEQSIPPEFNCSCRIKWEADVEFWGLTRSNTSLVNNL